MRCVSCSSQCVEKLHTELAIHSQDATMPLVFVFPDVLVCMHCGKLEIAGAFVVPREELRRLDVPPVSDLDILLSRLAEQRP